MSFNPAASAPSFALPGVTFTTLSSPGLGARENAVWLVQMEPGRPGQPHRISREETFVALSGVAEVTVDGQLHVLGAGQALAVPAGAQLSMGNPGPGRFEAIAVLPVGATVSMQGDAPFVPPWAA